MDAHHPAVEEAARAAMERLEATAAMPAIYAIKTIPSYLVKPAVIADLAAALATLAGKLGPEAREVAQNHLHDLHDDMRGFT